MSTVKQGLLIILSAAVFFLCYQSVGRCKEKYDVSNSKSSKSEDMNNHRFLAFPRNNNTENYRLFKANINTHSGWKSYDEVLEEVWKPFGYKLVVPTIPIATLQHIEKPTCDKIFADWLAIAKTHDPHVVPPREVPEGLKRQYTMNGNAHVINNYFDDRSTSSEGKWDQIEKWMNSDAVISPGYGDEGVSINSAMKHFNQGVKGKKGFVIGSLRPWVEVMALKNGASHIDTIEYRKTEIVGDWPITWIHPIEFSEKWNTYVNTYDFCATFSSIEHSGMQRYSDPPDPIGDLREMMKVRCLLKPGGYLFIAFPRGMDTLVYNIHRIYGRIRLAMMFAGFELQGFFQNTDPRLKMASSEYYDHMGKSGDLRQDTFVLKKI